MLLRIALLCCLVAGLSWPAACQTEKQQKIGRLGECRLASGEVIEDCRVGYRTFGKLNAQHNNVVIWPTWLLGRSEDIAQNVGPGRLLDPAKYMVIAIDALGNGISSSPSNSPSQARMSFPRFTIRDMVDVEHALLTRVLHLNHIHAIVGQSMGGFQAYQWMVNYPLFMDEVVTIMGTPRLTPSDLLWTSIEADSIRQDKDWAGGNYSKEPALTATRYTHLFVMGTPAQLNSSIRQQGAQSTLQQNSKFGDKWDANDWLYQLEAVQSMNIFGEESMSQTAAKIKCKLLIINGSQDLAVNDGPSIEFANALGLTPILLTGPCGHLAAGCELDKVLGPIQMFLATQ